jgi:hypothetical protein
MAQTETFVTVQQHVKARRLFIDQKVQLNTRTVQAYAGMWIVEAVGGAGHQLLMPDDVFRMQFRPTDTASEAAWKEQTNKVYPQWPDGKPIDLH